MCECIHVMTVNETRGHEFEGEWKGLEEKKRREKCVYIIISKNLTYIYIHKK